MCVILFEAYIYIDIGLDTVCVTYVPISVADTDMLCQACVSLSSGLVVVIMPSSEFMLKNCSTSVYRGIMYLHTINTIT